MSATPDMLPMSMVTTPLNCQLGILNEVSGSTNADFPVALPVQTQPRTRSALVMMDSRVSQFLKS